MPLESHDLQSWEDVKPANRRSRSSSSMCSGGEQPAIGAAAKMGNIAGEPQIIRPSQPKKSILQKLTTETSEKLGGLLAEQISLRLM